MDLGEWLRSLGLERYEAVFRENAIDADVIRALTEEHLRELGVPIGARLKLLKAIAELGGEAEPSDTAAGGAQPIVQAETAERRQVTVMFCDLVGSTALSARMDPEDLREVISAYQKSVTEIVQGFGGFVAKYMGDGVLVYFGYPQAHEDDAERAVCAGLEVVAAVAPSSHTPPFRAVSGLQLDWSLLETWLDREMLESEASSERRQTSRRGCKALPCRTVVIGESTRKLLGNLFELEDLGAKELKGIAGPVRVLAAMRTSSVAGRFEALHGSCLTDLVAGKKNRATLATLVEGEKQRRPSGASFWRTGHR